MALTLTETWECVNDHQNTTVVTFDTEQAVVNNAGYWLDENISSEYECPVCREVGTADGIRVTSDNDFVRGVIAHTETLWGGGE